MRAVVIVALVALFGAVACLTKVAPKINKPIVGGKPPGTNCWLPPALRKKLEEEKRLKELKEEEAKKVAETSGFNLSSIRLPRFNFSHHKLNFSHNMPKWNVTNFRFVEETSAPVKPTFVQRMKNHAKNLWAKRPWKKAPKTEESNFVTTRTVYPRTRNAWNIPPFRLEETPVQAAAPSFFDKIKNHAKNLWAKRPWKKAPVPEASSFNFSGFHLPTFNFSHHIHHHIPTFNFTHHLPKFNFSHFRFEENAAAPSFFDKIKNHAKSFWAKRPWNKTPKVDAPETSTLIPRWNYTIAPVAPSWYNPNQTWNPAGQVFPQIVAPSWNPAGQISFPPFSTWNPAGLKFEEIQAAPSFIDKIKNSIKGLWAKRPWKKAD